MNKIRIPSYIVIVSSLLFSLASINFAIDVSLFAFPLSVAISVSVSYILFVKILKNEDFKFLKITVKLLQYMPYALLVSFILRRAGKNGTPYLYDVFTVLFWCANFISSLCVLYFLDEKRVYSIFPKWAPKKQQSEKKDISVKKIKFEIIDWIDALVQAVFMVLLIQIFILQLYVIPSESMVPSFLIGDRVVVLKTPSGPKFPLSDIGFPCVKKYKRGDVIVFRNPHYSIDRKSEVRSVVSQIVYMLTFTGVNLNVDEHGEPKADPLVKRICGIPGEQLVMQDGTLYARTSESDEFKPVMLDKKFASWNLNSVSPKLKRGIQMFPLSEKQYEKMLEIEEERRNFSLLEASRECHDILKSFRTYFDGTKKSIAGTPEISLDEYDLFSCFYRNTQKILFSEKGFSGWFENFMTSWNQNDQVGRAFDFGHDATSNLKSIKASENSLAEFNGDYYAEANFKLNAMIKLCVGKLYLRTASLISKGSSEIKISEDTEIQNLLKKASDFHFYMMILDQRNMPVFPKNDIDGNPTYIPKNCYFMMGDNRFNSLDMRHSYMEKKVSLTEFDTYSVKYYSNMAPQYVNRKNILGSAVYRFWPAWRMGKVFTK